MFPSSHKHLTAKRRNVTSMTSLDIFALLSLFINLVFKAEWPMNILATQHEWVMSWLFWCGAADTSLSQHQRAAFYTTQKMICAMIKAEYYL